MKKIIWGIATVFCVQVGFQLAMTAERANDEYASLSTPLRSSVIASEQPAVDPDLLDTNIYIAPAPAAVHAKAETPRQMTRPAPAVIARAVRPGLPDTTRTASLKPVVIRYDRTGALTEGSAFSNGQKAPVNRDVPADEKRSLFAKIVTKPYDWLKAVGSKLR